MTNEVRMSPQKGTFSKRKWIMWTNPDFQQEILVRFRSWSLFVCLDSVWGVSSFPRRHWNRLLLVGLFPPNCETRNCSWNCLGSRRRFCKSFSLGLGYERTHQKSKQRLLKKKGTSPFVDYFCLVGNLNHPKLGTIILIVFDFQGMYIYIYIYIYYTYRLPCRNPPNKKRSLFWSKR